MKSTKMEQKIWSPYNTFNPFYPPPPPLMGLSRVSCAFPATATQAFISRGHDSYSMIQGCCPLKFKITQFPDRFHLNYSFPLSLTTVVRGTILGIKSLLKEVINMYQTGENKTQLQLQNKNRTNLAFTNYLKHNVNVML